MYWNNKNLIEVLKRNGVVVMPTDTIYGIVGKADNPFVVNRIYNIRKRAPNKPCIILIGVVDELENFSIHLSEEQKRVIKGYWLLDHTQDFQPRPVSIVLDCPGDQFEYLHRGTKTLAFRLPTQESLRNLLKETGPLIAPSANIEGLPPARNIKEAQKYFSDSVDLYIDGDILTDRPSKIIQIHKDGSVIILRA